MGRKKKFINKDEGVKFFLVHRSQRDPLYLDENLGEHVLVPADPQSHKGLIDSINRLSLNSKKNETEKEEIKRKRLEEQQKFGIYYEDDYDYLQHLREVDNEETEMEDAKVTKIGSVLIKEDDEEDERDSRLKLPSSVFASKYEEDVGYFNQAAPDHDPKIGWDPDIVKILDEDPNVDFDDDENELEDDFFIKANNQSSKSRDIDDDTSDVDSNCDREHYYNDDFDDEKEFDRKSRFSNYSMTSSVIRRNEALKQLDEHFENIFAQYDDEQIGALDTEEIDGFRISNDAVLESALEEFNKLMRKNLYKPEKSSKTSNLEAVLEHEESENDCKYFIYINYDRFIKLITYSKYSS
jgi:protein LTV1